MVPRASVIKVGLISDRDTATRYISDQWHSTPAAAHCEPCHYRPRRPASAVGASAGARRAGPAPHGAASAVRGGDVLMPLSSASVHLIAGVGGPTRPVCPRAAERAPAVISRHQRRTPPRDVPSARAGTPPPPIASGVYRRTGGGGHRGVRRGAGRSEMDRRLRQDGRPLRKRGQI